MLQYIASIEVLIAFFKKGANVVISFPHFLNAHPTYQNSVIGLSPDVNKHGIFLDLEPNTGYPLRGASRVQINIFLKSMPEVKLLNNLTNVLLPTVWLEERVELTDELIDIINSQLLVILLVLDIIKWLLLVSGVFEILGSCAFYFIKIKSRESKNSS